MEGTSFSNHKFNACVDAFNILDACISITIKHTVSIIEGSFFIISPFKDMKVAE